MLANGAVNGGDDVEVEGDCAGCERAESYKSQPRAIIIHLLLVYGTSTVLYI